MSKSLLFWLAVLMLFGGAVVTWMAVKAQQEQNRPSVVTATLKTESTPEPKPAPGQEWLTEFTLTDRTGEEFHSASLAGHVYVANFFYASCPNVCRLQNKQIALLNDRYASRGVKFVSITCDPANDTPAKLQQYAETFDAGESTDWHFLSGDLLYSRRIGADIYRVSVDKKTHSENLIVVDRQGEIRGRYHWNRPAELGAMRDMIDNLLAEEPAAAQVEEAHPTTDEAAKKENASA